jgi:NifU-like protein involved in Fe-S cluster formation
MSALYNLEILKLAASTSALSRLDNPQVSIEKRSPTCGSRVRIDMNFGPDGRVNAMGAALHACALGQASTALMVAHARGQSARDLADARDALRAYLKGERAQPGDWPGLEIFAPARKHAGRHASILLAFEAAAEAAKAASS